MKKVTMLDLVSKNPSKRAKRIFRKAIALSRKEQAKLIKKVLT